ncbi:MAG: hypothetical protein C0424_12170 [Sphingobacteriaceae bacterium]|nr:hypothetical protein [Sphingobacteriaceae bacterium]
MTKLRIFFSLLLAVALLACGPEEKQPELKDLERIALRNLQGQEVLLGSMLDSLNVLYFFAPECPLSENYCLSANLLQEKTASRAVRHLVVVPGDYYSAGAVDSFRRQFDLRVQVIRDTSWALTRALAARVTPEVFIFTNDQKMLYRGAIDNWVFALGKKRQRITEFYADTVVVAALNGKPLEAGSTRAIGCTIEIPD